MNSGMPLEDVLGEEPPVRAEVERDLFALVQQLLGVRHAEIVCAASRVGRSGADVAREQRRDVVAVVGIEVDRDQEPPGPLGLREPVDQRVVRGAVARRRRGARARARARSRAPTPGYAASRDETRIVPSSGVHEPQRWRMLSTQRTVRGRGRPYSRASRRARAATSMRGRIGAPPHALGELLRGDLRFGDRHPARERHPQTIADQHCFDVLAAPRSAYEFDLHVTIYTASRETRRCTRL